MDCIIIIIITRYISNICFRTESDILVQHPDEEKLVNDDHEEKVSNHHSGPKKSVSIVLPEDLR